MESGLARQDSPEQSSARWGIPLVFILMTFTALAYLFAYAHPLPVEDEFVLTRFVVEGAPDLIQIWGQHNEHRIPIPRVAYHVLARLGGADSRVILLGSVALLAGGALLFLLTAREMRNGFAWSDAAIPLLLLHPGHQATLLNAFQICFTFYVFWFGLLLFSATLWKRSPKCSLVGCLVAAGGLILTCSAGVVVTVAFLPWLIWKILDSPGNAEERSALRRLAMLATTSVAVLLAAYLYNLKTQKYPRSPGPEESLAAAVAFLGNGFGPGLGGFATAGGALLTGLFLFALYRWLVAWRSGERDSDRAACVCLCGGTLTLALVFGYTRASFGESIASYPRYIVLSAPLACVLLAVESKDRFAALAKKAILALALAALPLNLADGLRFGRERQALYQRVMSEYRAGATFEAIAEHYDPNYTIERPLIARLLGALEKQKLSVFAVEQRAADGR